MAKRKSTSDSEDEEYTAAGDRLHVESEEKPLQQKKLKVKKPKLEDIARQASEESKEDILVHTSSEGEKYVSLGKKKRATARSFKGTVMVDIREFYGGEGEEKPGKKGICLTLDQWNELKSSINTIDSLLTKIEK